MDAAAAITRSPLAGERIVESPGPLLPAAATTTTPASTVASAASSRKSCGPSCPPPRLMFTTCIPSMTVSSSAAAMSWLCAEPPKATNPEPKPGKTL